MESEESLENASTVEELEIEAEMVGEEAGEREYLVRRRSFVGSIRYVR